MTPDEERLRARFAALKKRDARLTPDFEKVRSAPRRPAPWRVVVPVLAAAAMLLLWLGTRTMRDSASAPLASAPATHGSVMGGEVSGHATVAFDPAPLDFLLDMPGTAAAVTTLDSNPLAGW